MDKRRARATLATTCATHFLHDGFSDLLYVFFPLWAREFVLSFAQVGLLRTAYSGAMASFQVPAGVLAERWGERGLLAAGTALTAVAFLTLGLAGGFASLVPFLLVAGLGSGVQHPLSSSLVSKAYETGPRRVALGTFNFSGDLGKVTVPTLVGLAAAAGGWRGAAAGYGSVGLLAALGIFFLLSRLGYGEAERESPGPTPDRSFRSQWGIRDRRGFQALSAIGIIDNATRTAFLTFLPFLLIAKGSTVETVALALALVFGGGAMGKFVCGAMAERAGVIRTVVLTELVTGGGILLLLPLPLAPALILLPILGVGLNGTSSVLYGTVADLVTPERRSRAYGLFYTLGLGSGAVAPSVYGLVSDWAGVPVTLGIIGLGVLTTIPLSQLLRAPIAGEAPSHPL
ncbi:MAG: MFS transporter [Candidatus Rokubacteria bacterium]|nr:MFS transporter [Candidatus Rokubacteria bacterium]